MNDIFDGIIGALIATMIVVILAVVALLVWMIVAGAQLRATASCEAFRAWPIQQVPARCVGTYLPGEQR